jgi:hypothetical protein
MVLKLMSSSPRQPLQGRADWAAAGEANSQIVVQLLYFYSRSETSTGGASTAQLYFALGFRSTRVIKGLWSTLCIFLRALFSRTDICWIGDSSMQLVVELKVSRTWIVVHAKEQRCWSSRLHIASKRRPSAFDRKPAEAAMPYSPCRGYPLQSRLRVEQHADVLFGTAMRSCLLTRGRLSKTPLRPRGFPRDGRRLAPLSVHARANYR